MLSSKSGGVTAATLEAEPGGLLEPVPVPAADALPPAPPAEGDGVVKLLMP